MTETPDIVTFSTDARFYTNDILDTLKRQVKDFTNNDKKLFKKSTKVENVYANFKQKQHFNMRYDKKIINLHNLTLLYFCEKILSHV